MAGRSMEVIILAMAIVTTLWATAVAQSSSCTNVIISMSPCLDYITGNSSSASSSCCSQLAKVVKSQPQCLCEVLNGGASSLGVNVNQTQALALPNACNVQTPPTSRCNTGTPNSPSAGNGSRTVPSTDKGTSDASSTKMTVSRLFILQLFITISYASTFVTHMT